MSTQLSLYWQAPDQLEWYWAGDSDVYSGSLEELQDQKQLKNLEICLVRLFLPSSWFSTLELKLPVSGRRVSSTALKFAAEEYLAQDIDTVHLVLKGNAVDGKALVEVTEIERFRTILQTLTARGLRVMEAFNVQWFSAPENQTEDIVIQVQDHRIVLSAKNQVYNLHSKGFAQWFELWSKQSDIADDASIKLVSDVADGPAKAISTEFEASGFNVSWVVQNQKQLIDWHEEAARKKHSGNLVTGEFSQRSGNRHTEYWLPSLVACCVALVLWIGVTVLDNQRMSQQIEQVWQANENVFLQVFGQSKRVQRPLMVREMRTLAANNAGSSANNTANALQFLTAISQAAPSFILEDFRFNKERAEASFTLVQPIDQAGDAYSLFETLKNELAAKKFTVEYSANQDKDAFRARYKTVLRENG